MAEALAPLSDVEARIGYRFRDPKHLIAALTHSSAIDATRPRVIERLEFLGDAVLGLVFSDLLIRAYPLCNEGRLSKFRASLVSTVSFAAKARELGLDKSLTLGKGEEKTGGRGKSSILAAVYEAVIGAIFLDSDYQHTRDLVARHFDEAIQRVEGQVTDPKTELQELCQHINRTPPVYRLAEQTGPDHARHFVVDVLVGDAVLARGEGTSKRSAEQAAARRALQLSLDRRRPPLV